MPLAGKAAVSYASYSAASYASYPSGVVARDVPQPSDVAPSNLHHASRNELDGNGDRLSKEAALEVGALQQENTTRHYTEASV